MSDHVKTRDIPLAPCWLCGHKKPWIDIVNKVIGTACRHRVKRARVHCRNKRCKAQSKKTMDTREAKLSWNERAARAAPQGDE